MFINNWFVYLFKNVIDSFILKFIYHLFNWSFTLLSFDLITFMTELYFDIELIIILGWYTNLGRFHFEGDQISQPTQVSIYDMTNNITCLADIVGQSQMLPIQAHPRPPLYHDFFFLAFFSLSDTCYLVPDLIIIVFFRATIIASTAFLDAFQKIADMATSTRGMPLATIFKCFLFLLCFFIIIS